VSKWLAGDERVECRLVVAIGFLVVYDSLPSRSCTSVPVGGAWLPLKDAPACYPWWRVSVLDGSVDCSLNNPGFGRSVGWGGLVHLRRCGGEG
jgi:hypothetical protein